MAIRDIIILPDKAAARLETGRESSRPSCASSSTTCSRRCTTRPASAWPRSRSAPPRLVTMDLAGKAKAAAAALLHQSGNLSASDELSLYEEGCLSIPDYYEEVERPAKVRVRFMDRDGKANEKEADGLFAICIQHEMDHLEGMLFVDHLSRLKRERVLKKFAKAAKREGVGRRLFAPLQAMAGQARPTRKLPAGYFDAMPLRLSSWARRISRCRRCCGLPAQGTRSRRSIAARPSLPGAARSEAVAGPSSRGGSALPCGRRRR